MMIDVMSICPNPQQPRSTFDEDALVGLAKSIQATGLIQPVVVEDRGNGMYWLIDGERRWRAHQMAGLPKIEAVVRPAKSNGDRDRLLQAFTANLHRADLNSIEEGRAYLRMKDEFGMTKRQIAKAVGKSVTVIAGPMMAAKMEPEIQEIIVAGLLPASSVVMYALKKVPAGKTRIDVVWHCVRCRVTQRRMLEICKEVAENGGFERGRSGRHKTPVEAMAAVDLVHWNAIAQIGKVPPWPIVQASVMRTCQACELAEYAGPDQCGYCPLVHLLTRLVTVSTSSAAHR
jgi:ParB/RepB/Spo0J family partition protein